MNKKLIGISLLLIWMGQCSPGFLTYSLQRLAHRHSRFSRSRSLRLNEEVETIVFSKHEPPEWEVIGKEFVLNNHLYDVVTIEESGDKLIIQCLSDEKEDQMVAAYRQSQQEDSRPDQALPALKKILDLKFLSPLFEYHFESQPCYHYATAVANNLCQVVTDIPVPPPECS